MKLVTLLHHYGNNNPGEVCSFEDAEADSLVRDGLAAHFSPPAPDAPAEATPAKEAESAAPPPQS